MRSPKLIVTSILLLLIVTSIPTAAYAVKGTITVNGLVVAQTDDLPACLIDPGQTSCTATAPILEVQGPTVIILPGGAVEATAEADNITGTTAVPGVINSIKVTGLALLYQGGGTGTVEISYSNTFPLPADVWNTPGFGGFTCTTASDGTLIPSDSGNLICRTYGYTETGTFCRVDPSTGDCSTADPDIAGMTSSVTFEKSSSPTTTATQPIGTGLTYSVASGGVSNNEFFPATKVGTPIANIACDPLVNGTCAAVEILNPDLVFTLNSGDAFFLSGSPVGVGGPNPGQVNNRLKFAEIDIQPIYAKNNNDINLTSSGQRSVAVLSSKTFDPRTIIVNDPAHPVLFRVGGGSGVLPAGPPTFQDLNKDGIPDAVFTFSVPALAAAGGNCAPPVGVLTGTATFTSTFQEQVGTKKNKQFQDVTVQETLKFSGSQAFTCAPSAGF